MKKLLTSCFALLVIVIFPTSCNKGFLDITPDGKMSLDEVFQDQTLTESYLNTVYGYIPRYYTGYWGWSFLAAFSDEAQDAETGNDTQGAGQWAAGALNPSYDPMANKDIDGNANTYESNWSGIRHANIFLERIGGANIISEDVRNGYIGEAKLLRAFYYWELIRKYGPMPVVTTPFDNAFDYTSLVRPTFQEVVDFIVKECDDVIANRNVPLRITSEANRTRFTRAVAHAVKSQALLYNASPLWNPGNDNGKWAAAAKAAKDAISELTNGGAFALASNYREYFLSITDFSAAPKDKETIYERRTAYPGTVISIPSRGGNWKLGHCPSQELVDAYDMKQTGEPAILGYRDPDRLNPIINPASGYDPENPYVGRDPRFYATVFHNGSEWDNIGGRVHIIETYVGGKDQLLKTPPNRLNTRTGYYFKKFVDPSLQVAQEQTPSFKKYRLAELYLSFAEAENETAGPTSDVYNAINLIRERADMPDLPLGLSKEEMRERIRRERRVEFAWEEHRFWDVRRWKILHQTDKLVTGMEIRLRTGEAELLVANGGFENELSGWYSHGGVAVGNEAHSGSKAVRISGTSGGYVSQNVAVKPNTDYIFSVWIRADKGPGYVGVKGFGGEEKNTPHDGDQWVEKTINFTTGSDNTTAEIFSWWPDGNTGYVDGFNLRQVGDNKSYTYERFVVERRESWQDKYLIFPIPLTDISIIPDFAINQNPGW